MTGRIITFLEKLMERNKRLMVRMGMAVKEKEPVTLEKKERGTRVYYYRVDWKDGKRKRRYVGTKESKAVRQIAADSGRRARIAILEHNNNAIREFLSAIIEDNVEEMLDRMKQIEREIAPEGFLDGRIEQLKQWAAAPYIRNGAAFPDRIIRACDGTRVRSKGEVFWYNLLTELGIPFRYDCRITVVDKYGRKTYEYPDFLIQCYDGSYIIIEHFGKLGEDGYLYRQADKIQNYLREGFVLGVNFFVTSDDKDGGTDAAAMKRLAWQIEELFYFGTGAGAVV